MTILGISVAREVILSKSGLFEHQLPSGFELGNTTDNRQVRTTDVLISVYGDIELSILDIELRD
jgi:hypothetical protein